MFFMETRKKNTPHLKSGTVPVIVTLLLSVWTGGYAGANDAPRPILMRHAAMATNVEILMLCPPDGEPEAFRQAARDAFAAIDALEARVSRFRADSFVTLANRNAAERTVAVPGDMMALLRESRRISDRTGGAFDITVGPIITLWGLYEGRDALPSPEEIAEAAALVGMEHVVLDDAENTVFFTRQGVHMDFGGVAKGLALDRAAAVLRDHGVESARLNIGTSTILALGAPPGKTGWTVDIRSPYNNDEGAFIASVEIRDEALSTSSRSERYIKIEGRKYGHIVDPRTGSPADGVLSASAIVPSGLESDALSTAFYVMGYDETRRYCETYSDARAILMVEENGAPEVFLINMNQDNGQEKE